MDDGRVRVTLSDESTVECDFLVAADGANSKVRAALRPNETLQYAGAVSISANAKFDDGLPDIIKEDHGMVLGGHGSGLFLSPVDDHSAVWCLGFLEPSHRKPV